MKIENGRARAYKIVSVIILVILAVLFTFPLYWIITGAFKSSAVNNSPQPTWWPTEWVTDNFEALFKQRTAPLWEIFMPFGSFTNPEKNRVVLFAGPDAPAAFRWLINAVFMAVAAMIITCVTAAMAGYALAKKRFNGRAILFSLIVCAMALPKQVILIPLLKEMSALRLYDSLWAVIFPTVGWPFGVFLMKQFSESIPGEILEAARVDGCGPIRTYTHIMLPMSQSSLLVCAVLSLVWHWNDYFEPGIYITDVWLKMLPNRLPSLYAELSKENYTMIAKNDIEGLIFNEAMLMAATFLCIVPILIMYLILQRRFMEGVERSGLTGM